MTHRPDDNSLSFTPTERLIKQPLYAGEAGNKKLVEVYDGYILLAKALSSLVVGIAIWVLTEYGFGGTSGGNNGSAWVIDFLNAGSRQKVQDQQ